MEMGRRKRRLRPPPTPCKSGTSSCCSRREESARRPWRHRRRRAAKVGGRGRHWGEARICVGSRRDRDGAGGAPYSLSLAGCCPRRNTVEELGASSLLEAAAGVDEPMRTWAPSSSPRHVLEKS
jgi:hypothetical protein